MNIISNSVLNTQIAINDTETTSPKDDLRGMVIENTPIKFLSQKPQNKSLLEQIINKKYDKDSSFLFAQQKLSQKLDQDYPWPDQNPKNVDLSALNDEELSMHYDNFNRANSAAFMQRLEAIKQASPYARGTALQSLMSHLPYAINLKLCGTLLDFIAATPRKSQETLLKDWLYAVRHNEQFYLTAEMRVWTLSTIQLKALLKIIQHCPTESQTSLLLNNTLQWIVSETDRPLYQTFCNDRGIQPEFKPLIS